MASPFNVGEHYANNIGEYVVLAIDGEQMTVRYDDGREQVLDVALQARIVSRKRYEAEEALAAQRAALAPPRTARVRGEPRLRNEPPRSDERGHAFRGLVETDFQRGAAGTHWRARDQLGGLVARLLSERTGRDFQSFDLFRRAEVHIALADRYGERADRKVQVAKFVVVLCEEGALFGFYIERDKKPIDDAWHWPRFLRALREDAAVGEAIQTAMEEQAVSVSLYEENTAYASPPIADAAGPHWPGSAWHGARIDWPALADYLAGYDPTRRCNLYICARLPREEALAAGVGIGQRIADVCLALMPVYLKVIG